MSLTYIFKWFKNMSKRKNKKKGKKKMNIGMGNNGFRGVGNTIITPSEPVEEFWEEKIDCISECGKAPSVIDAWIQPLAKEKIEALMGEYKNIEWLAYLIGDFKKNGEDIEITDIFVPDQEITATSVDNIVCDEFNELSIIGVIHSHHSMGNNFSGIDDKYINQNHNISLCISNSGINGHVRWVSPCGAYKVVDCKVKLKTKSLLDKDDFLKNIKEKIKRKSYVVIRREGEWSGVYNNSQYNEIYKTQGVPIKQKKNSLSSILTDDEINEIENEIEELDFEKEISVEEELELMNEMNKISGEENSDISYF